MDENKNCYHWDLVSFCSLSAINVECFQINWVSMMNIYDFNAELSQTWGFYSLLSSPCPSDCVDWPLWFIGNPRLNMHNEVIRLTNPNILVLTSKKKKENMFNYLCSWFCPSVWKSRKYWHGPECSASLVASHQRQINALQKKINNFYIPLLHYSIRSYIPPVLCIV